MDGNSSRWVIRNLDELSVWTNKLNKLSQKFECVIWINHTMNHLMEMKDADTNSPFQERDQIRRHPLQHQYRWIHYRTSKRYHSYSIVRCVVYNYNCVHLCDLICCLFLLFLWNFWTVELSLILWLKFMKEKCSCSQWFVKLLVELRKA